MGSMKQSPVTDMKHVDLFSGIGGFSLGFERAGVETVAFCERDEYCQGVLNRHWPEVPICPTIEEFPIWWQDHKVEGEVYVVSAGFPCQPFSFAGRKEGVEDDRWLWPQTAAAIRTIRPKYILLENVAALISYGDAFGEVLGDIFKMGFNAEWGVVSASEFGPKQPRKRLVVLSYPNCEYGREGSRMGSGSETIKSFKATRLPRPSRFERWTAQEDWSQAEPIVHRVVNGIPTAPLRNRLRSLGNAVVPQIAEYYAKVIVATEARGIV